ncbi:MAG: hypothetical protein K2X95_07870, partial [Flavobacteriaceae bacterium]|nr:hypothetical protein [Flavobacteriaceae bacterium]
SKLTIGGEEYYAPDATMLPETRAYWFSRINAAYEKQDLKDRLEIEDRKRQLEDRKLESEERLYEHRNKIARLHQVNIESRVDFLKSVFPNNKLDDRCQMMVQDLAMNAILTLNQQPTPTLTTLTTTTTAPLPLALPPVVNILRNSLSVADILRNITPDHSDKNSIQIGGIAAKLFRKRYANQEPEKHIQTINGRSTPVNHYAEKDHDLVKTAYEQFQLEKNKKTLKNG